MATRKPSMMTIRKYSKDMPAKVFDMASRNVTRTKMCEELGITLENFRQFLEKYHEFANAYKLGKETFREEMLHKVEEQMYDSIVPKTRNKVTKYYNINSNGEKVLSHTTEEEKVEQPDTSMLKFIAKNLDPEKWGDQKPLDTGGETLQMQGKEWAEYIMGSCGIDNISNAIHIEDRSGSNEPPRINMNDSDIEDVEPVGEDDNG